MILEEYGSDIIHIAGVDNIVADAISRLPMADHDQNGHCTDVQGRMNEMFNIREGHNDNGPPDAIHGTTDTNDRAQSKTFQAQGNITRQGVTVQLSTDRGV